MLLQQFAAAHSKECVGQMVGEGIGLNCLLVEDHVLVADLLSGILQTVQGIGSIRVAHSLRESFVLIDRSIPDLLILDLALADGDGQQVAMHLLKWNPSPTIILLSSNLHDFCCCPELLPHIHAMVDKTSAYKDFRNVLKGIGKLPIECLGGEDAPRRIETLSNRELEVFLLIGAGKKSFEIARQLNISVSTVGVHRKSICQIIGSSGADLVRLAALHLHRMEMGQPPLPYPSDRLKPLSNQLDGKTNDASHSKFTRGWDFFVDPQSINQ
jgi:DNA-binding NarL/FixJ family response regulator